MLQIGLPDAVPGKRAHVKAPDYLRLCLKSGLLLAPVVIPTITNQIGKKSP